MSESITTVAIDSLKGRIKYRWSREKKRGTFLRLLSPDSLIWCTVMSESIATVAIDSLEGGIEYRWPRETKQRTLSRLLSTGPSLFDAPDE